MKQQGYSCWVNVGRYRGFRVFRDGPSVRVYLGWVSICLAAADTEQVFANLLARVDAAERVAAGGSAAEGGAGHSERAVQPAEAAEMAQLRERLHVMEEDLNAAQSRAVDLETGLASRQAELQTLQQELEKCRNQPKTDPALDAKLAEFEALKPRLKALKEAEQEAARSRLDKEALEGEVSDLEDEISDLQDENTLLLERQEEVQRELLSLRRYLINLFEYFRIPPGAKF